MAVIKQHGLLLSLMAILVIAKFVVVPVIDWQSNIIADIRLLEKKQAKITTVIATQDDNQKIGVKLSNIIAHVDTLFFPYQGESAFKLSQQKMLEALLAKHELKSQNIGWGIITPLDELSAVRYQLQMRFSGSSINVIEFISALESHPQLIDVIDFNLSLKRQRDEYLGTMSGRMTLHLYADNTTKTIGTTGGAL